MFTAVASLIPRCVSLSSRAVLPPILGCAGTRWRMRRLGEIDPTSECEMATWRSLDPHSKSNPPAVTVSGFHRVMNQMSPNVDYHQSSCGNCLEMWRPCVVGWTETKRGPNGTLRALQPSHSANHCTTVWSFLNKVSNTLVQESSWQQGHILLGIFLNATKNHSFAAFWSVNSLFFVYSSRGWTLIWHLWKWCNDENTVMNLTIFL